MPDAGGLQPARQLGADATSRWIDHHEVGRARLCERPRRGVFGGKRGARDLAVMPSLRPVEARVLDMFPHTTHYEVLVLLAR